MAFCFSHGTFFHDGHGVGSFFVGLSEEMGTDQRPATDSPFWPGSSLLLVQPKVVWICLDDSCGGIRNRTSTSEILGCGDPGIGHEVSYDACMSLP